MAKTISLSFPGNLGVIVFGTLLVIVLYTVFKLLATAAQVYKFRQLLSRSIVKDHKFYNVFKALNLVNKVVILRENKPFAYCFGVRNPKIYLTTGLISLVDKEELRVVLCHEKYHLEHRDNLVLLLATFIESLFPFLPILTDLIRIYKTDRELLADKAAVHGIADKHSLLSTLKKLLQYEPVTFPALAPAIADLDTIETRIKSLLSIKVEYRKLRKRNIFYSLLFIGILMILMSTPVNAFELHKNGVDAMIVCNKNVSCESVCRDKGLTKSQSSISSYTSKNFSTSK